MCTAGVGGHDGLTSTSAVCLCNIATRVRIERLLLLANYNMRCEQPLLMQVFSSDEHFLADRDDPGALIR